MKSTTKVLRYIAKHPNAKAKEVAKATGVTLAYVYNITSKAKRAGDTAFKASVGRGRPRMKTIAVSISNTSVSGRMATAADNVNHPAHYKTGGIETIDFIEAKSLDYHLGNVVKYITRADHKGNRKEDLLKAQWYLNRAISKL